MQKGKESDTETAWRRAGCDRQGSIKVGEWSFPNKRILRNNLCFPACKQKNIATKLRDTA